MAAMLTKVPARGAHHVAHPMSAATPVNLLSSLAISGALRTQEVGQIGHAGR